MEFEIKSLHKLKKLENILTELIDKIDYEIIQTDVEWLHLKSISESQNSSVQEDVPATPSTSDMKPSKESLRKMKIEIMDDLLINASQLELATRKSTVLDTLEEFDSD
ncbi:unnamed protein product [Phaedon cochleariae]|uniref:Uncharacterized protein n=1 Tax=Phaedon cochleariae TaxID=80249 RepID=A0A9P0DSH4_PHACE|nr:unnamed protein product [Phaedon cochleariae]